MGQDGDICFGLGKEGDKRIPECQLSVYRQRDPQFSVGMPSPAPCPLTSTSRDVLCLGHTGDPRSTCHLVVWGGEAGGLTWDPGTC